jgi:hypothetical protein
MLQNLTACEKAWCSDPQGTMKRVLLGRSFWIPTQKDAHQRRLNSNVLEQAAEAVNCEELIDWMQETRGFEDLYNYLKSLCYFKGLGPVYYYDIALRIGWCNGIEPEKYVYLHAGPAVAAKSLGLSGRTVCVQSFYDKCSAFKQMTAKDIENFLCIYRKEIAQIWDVE